MKERSLYHINMNIKYNEKLINEQKAKKEKIMLKPVKESHCLVCGVLGSMISTFGASEPSFDALMFRFIGGFALGALVPFALKKIKIADSNYQLYMYGKIADDLEKEKEEKIKKL